MDVAGPGALVVAAEAGDVAAVQSLLRAHASPDDAEPGTGNTALMVACKERHARVVTALLDGRADPNRAGKGAWTPLHQACLVRNNEPVIAALLAAPLLRVDAKNDDGNTALHYWCRTYKAQDKQNHLLLCQLISMGCDVNARNNEGETPLFVACWRNNVTTVAWLLDHGANPALCNSAGHTCLHAAAMMGYDAVLSWLLSHPRCDEIIGVLDASGKTALDLHKGGGVGSKQREALQEATLRWRKRDEMRKWLTSAGIDRKYHARFEMEEFDLGSLQLVTDEVLRGMKLPAAARLSLLHALRQTASSPQPAAQHGPAGAAVQQGGSPCTTTDMEDDTQPSSEEADVQAQLAMHRVPVLPPEQLLIRHVVGSGFFSEVRLAQWNGVLVAVKTITDSPNRSKSQREMFLAEVAIMSRLRHPHIVQLLGVTMGGGTLSIVTEYMGGGTLHGLVRSPRWTPEGNSRYFSVALQICKGMTYLHSTNTLHRDLTSRNVLLDTEQTVKIADFGVSRLNSVDYISPHPVGALPYVAPEVYLHHRYSHASDVYSMGIIMWEMLTGTDPNGRMRPKEMADEVANKRYRPALPPQTSQVLRDLITRAWHDDPAQRPTFLALMEALDGMATSDADEGYVDKLDMM